MRPRPPSLRLRLYQLVAVVAVPLVLLSAGVVCTKYLADRDHAAQRAEAVAHGLALTVEGELHMRVAVLQMLAASRDLADGDLAAFRGRAAALLARDDPGGTIVLLREDGQEVMNLALPPGAPLPVRRQQDSLRQVFATGAPVISDVFPSAAQHRPVVSVDVPVKRADGSVSLVLALTPAPQAFEAAIQRQNPPPGWVVSVLDRHGVAVARMPNPERFVGKPTSPTFLPVLLAGESGVADTTSLEGTPLLSAWSRPGPSGWSVAVGIPRAAFYAPLWWALGLTLGLSALLLLAALALASLLAARIARPIRALADIAAMEGVPQADRFSLGLREADATAVSLAAAFRNRDEAEAALRESQAELHSIVDSAAEGIIVARADGRITSVNRAALRMFGYDVAEELVGHDLGVLMNATDAARYTSYLTRRGSGGQPRVIGMPGRELTAARRDGSTFLIDLSVASFDAGGQCYLTGIVRDATARKQAEADLRTNEARLRLVQQVGGIAYVDLRLPEATGIVSAAYVTLYGLPPGITQITEAEWLGFLHPDDRDRVTAEIGALKAGGEPLATEFRIRRTDGAVRWIAMRGEAFFNDDGQPLRLISAQQDITEIVAAREEQASRTAELERRVAERTAALAEAEARFRAIFDSQMQIIGLLAPDGTVLEANRTALETGDVSHQRVVGRPFWELGWWPETERGRLRQEIAEAAQGAVIRRDARIVGAGGRGLWIDFSLKPVRDAAGRIVWIIPEGRDITEQRNLAAQLVQAQKVQALGQLASGIAHDFNNILQAVEGAATLIERRPEDVERTRRLARMAIDATARGGSITQRLLSFARRGEMRTEVLPAADLLGNIREVLAHTLGTMISVQCVVPPGVPPLVADRGQLETALLNLGTNARDAMPQGGTLTLAAEAASVADDADRPTGLPAGAYVRLSVTDTGAGMDAATLAQATEAFFTTKPAGQGTGLGLPMVKAFAEQSGGALTIASTPGVGTTVTLWLPQAGDAHAGAPGQTHRKAALDTSARVLLVDDDDMVRETLAAQLEDLGFGIVMASNGAEAIALLQADAAVDALVSDLSMPEMDGVTTIHKALALRPGLRCFLLTGYVGERATLAAGNAFTLVRKPISAEALAARIEAGLETTHREKAVSGPG
ncbi:PAS domain S-box protein [Rhodopila globiformis]|nr:PAS domain S-box protein [Rhodopila globiformis]